MNVGGVIRNLSLTIIMLMLITTVTSHAQNYVPGRVIVKFRDSNASGNPKLANKVESENNFEKSKSWDSINMHAYQGKAGESTEEMIAILQNDPDVEYVEPDYIMNKQSLEAVQAYSISQVQNFATGFGLTSSQVHGVEAWAAVTSHNDPIVAVIDTGVDLTHASLSDALWRNSYEVANNGVDDDGNGYIDDVYGWNFADGNNNPDDCDGHGTHVAGIIRGTTQDLFKVPSPDPAIIQIMALKFLDCNGEGTTSAAISAIYYAVNNGAKILNNSWGGGNYSRALHEAIIYSYNAKTVFVAASGNASNNNDSSKTYPAGYDVPNVIAVAATTTTDALASFSNYGSKTVHVAAPGTSILSTYPGDQYATLSGTSMATPFISGVAALMINEKPQMNGYQLKGLITSTVDHKSQLNGKVISNGRVNHLAAVSAAKSTDVNAYQPDYGLTVSGEDRGLASAMSGGAGCGMVKAINDVRKMNGGNGGAPIGTILIISVLLLIPVLLFQKLRKKQPQFQRAYERFEVSSDITMKVGDSEIKGHLSTLSMGGVGIDTQAMIEKGSVLTIKIQAPDGTEMEVKGKVVWRSQTQSYGIQFTENSGSVLERISAWTRMLTNS